MDANCTSQSSSLLSSAQFNQVVFHNLVDCYPHDSNLECTYSIHGDIQHAEGDQVGVFQVGWQSIDDAHSLQPAPKPTEPIIFNVKNLPKDEKMYQLCYVTEQGMIAGASIPFFFRSPSDNEWVAVENTDNDFVTVENNFSVMQSMNTKLTLQNQQLREELQWAQNELQVAHLRETKDASAIPQAKQAPSKSNEVLTADDQVSTDSKGTAAEQAAVQAIREYLQSIDSPEPEPHRKIQLIMDLGNVIQGKGSSEVAQKIRLCREGHITKKQKPLETEEENDKSEQSSNAKEPEILMPELSADDFGKYCDDLLKSEEQPHSIPKEDHHNRSELLKRDCTPLMRQAMKAILDMENATKNPEPGNSSDDNNVFEGGSRSNVQKNVFFKSSTPKPPLFCGRDPLALPDPAAKLFSSYTSRRREESEKIKALEGEIAGLQSYIQELEATRRTASTQENGSGDHLDHIVLVLSDELAKVELENKTLKENLNRIYRDRSEHSDIISRKSDHLNLEEETSVKTSGSCSQDVVTAPSDTTLKGETETEKKAAEIKDSQSDLKTCELLINKGTQSEAEKIPEAFKLSAEDYTKKIVDGDTFWRTRSLISGLHDVRTPLHAVLRQPAVAGTRFQFEVETFPGFSSFAIELAYDQSRIPLQASFLPDIIDLGSLDKTWSGMKHHLHPFAIVPNCVYFITIAANRDYIGITIQCQKDGTLVEMAEFQYRPKVPGNEIQYVHVNGDVMLRNATVKEADNACCLEMKERLQSAFVEYVDLSYRYSVLKGKLRKVEKKEM